jgi:hypothetical protein
MEEYAREPCPWRIVDDCGGAFTMGCIGGAVFQSIKGFRNAPSGFNRRLASSLVGETHFSLNFGTHAYIFKGLIRH